MNKIQENTFTSCQSIEVSPRRTNVKYAQISVEEVSPRRMNVKYAQL